MYIFSQHYDGGRTLVYAGKAASFANRLAEHFGNLFSSLSGTLYHTDGSVFRPGGRSEFFRSLQNDDLKELFSRAQDAALRTKFIYSPMERNRTSIVEATLISEIKRSSHKGNYEVLNGGHRANLVSDIQIQHDCSKLEPNVLTMEEQEKLCEILSLNHALLGSQ